MAKKVRLTQGYFALVDDEDFSKLSKWRWKVLKSRNCIYACRSVPIGARTKSGYRPYITILMHRLIFGAEDGQQVDHVNRNGLDNRKKNLRLCNHSQNGGNARKFGATSQYRGVHWSKEKQKWHVQIAGNPVKYLGRFESEIEAAKAYDKAAKERFREFANLNFPEGEVKTHFLKTHPEPFQAVLDRRKRHEWRKDDRNFDVGHILVLQEWDPEKGDYTRRETRVKVTYISRGPAFNIPEGYCIMSVVYEVG